MKPVSPDISVSHRDTRSTAQQQLNLPTVIEASFVMSHRGWRDIYDHSARKMLTDWTDILCKRVSSCNFRCTLAFQTHTVGAENSRKKTRLSLTVSPIARNRTSEYSRSLLERNP